MYCFLEPVERLEGHQGTVCSLDAGKFGTILSGSWDKYVNFINLLIFKFGVVSCYSEIYILKFIAILWKCVIVLKQSINALMPGGNKKVTHT